MLKPLIKSAIVIGKVVNKKVVTLEVQIDQFEDCIEGFDGDDDVTAKIE